jgi:hypothetical protein
MNALLVSAIEKKLIIEFLYDGSLRRVEPHTYGINHKGNEVLSAYQISPEDPSRIPWRLFDIEKIDRLQETSTVFIEPENGYKRGTSIMRTIFCEL